MQFESGFSANGAPYEVVVAEKKTALVKVKKCLLVLLYILWTAVILLVGASVRLIAPLLAFVPISLWVLIFFTWRYTQVEYEYSLFSGELTVSRILGGRSKKVMERLVLRQASAIFPYDEAHAKKAEAFAPQKTILAAGSLDDEDLYAILWADEKGTKKLLWINMTEKTLRIMKYYNAAAFYGNRSVD